LVQAYKTETEPVSFFKILIGFFYGSVFSVIFFCFLNFFFSPLIIRRGLNANHAKGKQEKRQTISDLDCLGWKEAFTLSARQ
jgi:hypothetical protein